jgi:hypothetical protein
MLDRKISNRLISVHYNKKFQKRRKEKNNGKGNTKKSV